MLIVSTRADVEAAFAEAEADLARVVTILAKANADPAEMESDLPKAFSDLAKAKADVAKAEADLAKARASCVTARNALARLNFAEGLPKTYRSESRRVADEAAPEKAHTNRRKANEDRRRARAALSRAHATGQMAGADRRKANEDRRFARRALSNLNCAELIVKSDRWAEKLMNGAANDPKPGTTASLSDRGASPRSTQSSEHFSHAVEKSATRQPSPRKESRRFIGHFSAQKAGIRDMRAWRPLVLQTVQLSSLTLAYLQYYLIDVNLQIAMLPSVVALFAG